MGAENLVGRNCALDIRITLSFPRRFEVPLYSSRREFVRDLGLGAATLPFVLNLPSLGFANQAKRKQRLVVMFSPNGVVPPAFWPDEEGAKDRKRVVEGRDGGLYGGCSKV